MRSFAIARTRWRTPLASMPAAAGAWAPSIEAAPFKVSTARAWAGLSGFERIAPRRTLGDRLLEQLQAAAEGFHARAVGEPCHAPAGPREDNSEADPTHRYLGGHGWRESGGRELIAGGGALVEHALLDNLVRSQKQ